MTRITAAEATRLAQAYLDAEGRDQHVLHVELSEDRSRYDTWPAHRGYANPADGLIINSVDLCVDAETGDVYEVSVVTGERLPSPEMARRP